MRPRPRSPRGNPFADREVKFGLTCRGDVIIVRLLDVAYRIKPLNCYFVVVNCSSEEMKAPTRVDNDGSAAWRAAVRRGGTAGRRGRMRVHRKRSERDAKEEGLKLLREGRAEDGQRVGELN